MEHILIVDDDAFSRKLVYVALTGAGFNVTTANDGEEAWRLLQKEDVHLIISDVEMPHMDGHEFARVTRADQRFAAIPFLFLSSHDRPEERQQGLELGAEDYLCKPLNASELVVKVRNILERHKVVHQSYRRLLQQALDRLPVAVALVTPELEVHFSNVAFKNLDGGVKVRDGRLCAGYASTTSRMEEAVKRAFRGLDGGCVMLPRDDAMALHMMVGAYDMADNRDEVSLVWVSFVDVGQEAEESQNPGRLFGFTPSENRVAELLLSGCSVAAIQERLGLARATVNAHLRGMFLKTETRRQAELIRRLLVTRNQLAAAGGMIYPGALAG